MSKRIIRLALIILFTIIWMGIGGLIYHVAMYDATGYDLPRVCGMMIAYPVAVMLYVVALRQL